MSYIYSIENPLTQVERIEREGIIIDYAEEIAEELNEVKAIVESVLSQSQIARNNDDWLLILSFVKSKKANFINHNGVEGFFIPKSNIGLKPKAESITRARRLINYDQSRPIEKRYLATDETILRRRLKEEGYKKLFGEKIK